MGSCPFNRLIESKNLTQNSLPLLRFLFSDRLLVLWIALLLLFSCGRVGAVQVHGLYEAEVPVAGQGVDQRNEAIREALAQVLLKVSGNRTVAAHKGVATDLRNASRYVQEYRYRLVPGKIPALPSPPEDGAGITRAMAEGAEAQAAMPIASPEPQRLLMVSFDEQAVNHLLRERGLPVWGINRPAILFWVGIEEGEHRRLLTPDLDGKLIEVFEETEAGRGLPLLMPLMDLEDQFRLRVSDLWGGFEINIRQASERYGPDLILTGRMVRVSKGIWRARWILYQENAMRQWGSEATDSLSLARLGMQELADLLAEQYALVAGNDQVVRLRIQIGNVGNLKDYSSVSRFLRGFDLVERANLVFAGPDMLRYELYVRGGSAIFEQEIALGGMLVRELGGGGTPVRPDGTVASGDEAELYYRLAP